MILHDNSTCFITFPIMKGMSYNLHSLLHQKVAKLLDTLKFAEKTVKIQITRVGGS